MAEAAAKLGTNAWRISFQERLHAQARLARLGHWRSVAPRPPRFVDGNQAHYLHDGRMHREWMIAAIDRAERRVDLEMYIFSPDEAGTLVRDALVRAAKRGVAVRLLYDSIGSNAAGPDFFEPITEAGGHVVEFNPVAPWRLRMSRLGRKQDWAPGFRNHRKLLVCDAPLAWARHPCGAGEAPAPEESVRDTTRCALAITGGRNIGDEYMTRPLGDGQWRDCGVVIFGPVACDLAEMFDAMWFHADGPDTTVPRLEGPPAGDLAVLALSSQPGFINLLQWSLSRLTHAVRDELRISCAYFIPSVRWRRTLAQVARRTGRCALLVPQTSDVPIVDAASRHLWGGLLKAGVAIYRYAAEVLHEKTYIYDARVTVIGSSNIDPRSFRFNYELSVVVVGEAFAKPVIAWYEDDLARSERYTLDTWRARPVWQKVSDWFWALWRSHL